MGLNCEAEHGAEHDKIKTGGFSLCRPDCVFSRKEDIVCRRIAGETFLVPIRGDLADMRRIFTLDAVAAFIWNVMDGNISLSGICDRLVETYDVTRNQAEADINDFVAVLLENGLVFG